MNAKGNYFECLEQQLLDLIGEFQTLSSSERLLREDLGAQCTRAESAEIARDVAHRVADEARADAAAVTASLTQATAAITKVNDELTSTKMLLELADHKHTTLEERCSELLAQVNAMERELQQLRTLKSSQGALHRQYAELKERVRVATEQAQAEVTRLENELRRVERCASAGTELRQRARLAAAAHARERRLVEAELQHTSLELMSANATIARLSIALAESQGRENGTDDDRERMKREMNDESEALTEARAALNSERAGVVRLERTLAAALAENVTLAELVAAADSGKVETKQPTAPAGPQATCNSALDNFLADGDDELL